MQWADLADTKGATYGVSILNDCKYGYDAQPSQLRLTLLRSPNWPDPGCDRGHHQFTYAIYPHAETWQTAHTTHKGYELNRPLQAFISSNQRKHGLPSQKQFLTLGADNLVLMALKMSEEDPHQWVLRCYECHGQGATTAINNNLKLNFSQTDNLLEKETKQDNSSEVQPWKIHTWMCSTK